MDFHMNHEIAGVSPSSSTSSSCDPNPNNSHHHNNGGVHHNNHNGNTDPMQSWWESISKARSRIHLLSSLLSPSSSSSSPPLFSLADSDRPARSLLSSPSAYSAISASLSSPSSGSGDDPLCQWLYETYQSSDPDLRLVVLSFIPLLSGLYLSRIHSPADDDESPSSPSPSLAGFEAVLLSLYAAETKSRAGKPILISIPDLSQPSLYHTPRNKSNSNPNPTTAQSRPSVGVISAPLEPQIAVKSTKRACIVGVALDCYYKQISQMPSWSKLDFCLFAADWAGQDCSCKSEFDRNEVETQITDFGNGIRVHDIEDVVEEMDSMGINENSGTEKPKGARIPLPWDLLQPSLRILGHCLLGPLISEDVKDSASVAVRCLYARASHDLVPQAILATRSLIQLDKRAREAAKVALANAASNANTPSKARKPEMLLVSK